MASSVKIELVFNAFPIMGQKMLLEANHICNQVAHQVETRAKLAIQSPPKTGRTYAHGKVRHQASAPGEAPATDTGALVNSGYTQQLGMADYEVGFTTEYAAALEFGTPTIEPRPYLRPAVEAERPGFEQRMRKLAEG